MRLTFVSVKRALAIVQTNQVACTALLLLAFCAPALASSIPIPTPKPVAEEGARRSILREQIHLALKANHDPISYAMAYDVLAEIYADPKHPENIILFYTARSQDKRLRVNQNRQDGWNREHLWPQSKGTRASPMRSDLHHLVPVDSTVNTSRGNLDFDDGGSPQGEALETFRDSDSFEPRNEIKGDIARAIFYMDVRYEGTDGEPNLKAVGKVKSGLNELGNLCTLLSWHEIDPVDDFERERNNKNQTIQGNRNLFVDQPDLALRLFGAPQECN